MRSARLALIVLVSASAPVAFVACAGGDSGTSGGPAEAGVVTSGGNDSGSFVFPADAGAEAAASPLLQPCDPHNPASCSTGFICYATHTSAAWWVDLYGTCTFACDDKTVSLCASLDGVCGCPVPQGGTAGACTTDGAAPMYCVPALEPGASPGAAEGDGGCGTPGCGGPGFEAGGGSPPDAGSGDDAGDAASE